MAVKVHGDTHIRTQEELWWGLSLTVWDTRTSPRWKLNTKIPNNHTRSLAHSTRSSESKKEHHLRTSRALRGLRKAKIQPSSSKEEIFPHTFYGMHKLLIILGQRSSLGANYDYCECMQTNIFIHKHLPAFYSRRCNTCNPKLSQSGFSNFTPLPTQSRGSLAKNTIEQSWTLQQQGTIVFIATCAL